MNFSMINLAKSATPTTGPSMWLMVIYLVLIFGAMYLFLIRPQKKKEKKEKEMRDNIQIGDEIITIGGIYGRVVSIKEETLVIESQSDHSKLTVSRWAIQANRTVHDTPVSK